MGTSGMSSGSRDAGAAKHRLCPDRAVIDPGAPAEAAKLFHDFGEEYHERIVEGEHMFPEPQKSGRPIVSLVKTFGPAASTSREITDYLYAIGKSGRIGTGQAEPLAKALEAMN